MAMTAGHFIRWANTDVPDDPKASRLRAAVAHAMVITLAGVADDVTASAIRRRLRAAEASLSTEHT